MTQHYFRHPELRFIQKWLIIFFCFSKDKRCSKICLFLLFFFRLWLVRNRNSKENVVLCWRSDRRSTGSYPFFRKKMVKARNELFVRKKSRSQLAVLASRVWLNKNLKDHEIFKNGKTVKLLKSYPLLKRAFKYSLLSI